MALISAGPFVDSQGGSPILTATRTIVQNLIPFRNLESTSIGGVVQAPNSTVIIEGSPVAVVDDIIINPPPLPASVAGTLATTVNVGP
jgi:hypothetical protein